MIIAIAIALVAAGEGDDELGAIKAREPDVVEVQQAALKQFGVHPDKVAGMRAGAAWKSALPTVEVSGGATGATINDNTVLDEYDPKKPWVIRTAGGNALELHTTLAWDLPRFAYNPEELDVAGLASVQKDIITKVTQTYYARRRVQMALAMAPPKDPAKKMAQELRVEELTAVLNGMTGGWFTQAITAKTKAASLSTTTAEALPAR